MTQYVDVIEKDTSVKSIHVIRHPTLLETGVADFIVRPQYSVFDWGAMPIPSGKEMDNRTLVVVSAYNFEMLEDAGIRTHYLGVVDAEGNEMEVEDMKPNRIPVGIRVEYVNKLALPFSDGRYFYSVFRKPPCKNYIVPLEFIFRNALPPESSLWKAFARGEAKPSDFGLPDDIKPGDQLPHPILDYTSKFEDKDTRYLSEQARELIGASADRWKAIETTTHMVNRLLTDHASVVGLQHDDGKIEYVHDNGTDMVGDFVGTWHEDRWTYPVDGMQVKVSKQTPRDLHKLLSLVWCEECDSLPPAAKARGIDDWRTLVTQQPEPLEPEFFDQYNNITRAATNAWIGLALFDASPLPEAAREFQKYLDDYKKRLQKT